MIRDFDIKDYPTLREYLLSARVKDDYMDILNVTTKVLLHDDKVIGFTSYNQLNNLLNLYHFYVDPRYRTKDITFELTDKVVDVARDYGCEYILAHTTANSDEERFLHKYCDYSKLGLKEIDSYIEGTNLYLWEV